jgi:hypothetical protein
MELRELIEKDDKPSINIVDAARFLGIDKECFRKAVLSGTCPFGIGGRNHGGNAFSSIHKLALWNWVNHTSGDTR